MKIETVTVHKVNASDLDQFINDTYGVPFSFQADQESADDTAHTFTVDGEVDEWDIDNINSVLEKGWGNFASGALLNYLANEGHIPMGDYVVEVW